MKHRIKLNGYALFLAGLALVFFPRVIIRRGDWAFDGFWEGLAVSLILIGQLLRVSARGYKSEQSYSGNHLVKTGPYALVRNPMYLGIILIGSGVVLFVLHLWTLLIFAAGFFFRYKALFVKEEQWLACVFGNDYEEYCRHVPRIIPRPHFFLHADVSSYLPLRLSWFMRELPSIAAVLVSVFMIETWEEISLHGLRQFVPALAHFNVILCAYILIIFILVYRYERAANKNEN